MAIIMPGQRLCPQARTPNQRVIGMAAGIVSFARESAINFGA